MRSLFDNTNGLDDIGEVYRRMEANCPNPASTSKLLWDLRRAPKISSYNTSEETMLEKAVAILGTRGHMQGWFNQCPVASGIGDSSADKRRNVDLVHWSAPIRHARLIELKWRSDDALEAVRQIVGYGAAYVFCRVRREQLPLGHRPVMDARHVSLQVVAPADYCRATGLPDRLARARDGLRRFDIGSRVDGLSMSLDVLAFPDRFDLPFVNGDEVRASCDRGELTEAGRMIRNAFRAARPALRSLPEY